MEKFPVREGRSTGATSPPSDHEIATTVAQRVGQRLLELRERCFSDGTPLAVLRAEADALAHDLISAALDDVHPGDAILSEEGVDSPQRLSAQRVWIIDPLDGTREFAEQGRVDWAVHVALWERDQLVAGAVALPAQGRVLSTAGPLPALAPLPSRPRVLVSRTRPHPLAERIAEVLDGQLVPMGSAGAKSMAVVSGDAEIYAHAGGQYEWDSAAPTVVAAAAGLYTSRLDGAPLRYNCPDPWLPDLLVCRQELAPSVLRIVGEALGT